MDTFEDQPPIVNGVEPSPCERVNWKCPDGFSCGHHVVLFCWFVLDTWLRGGELEDFVARFTERAWRASRRLLELVVEVRRAASGPISAQVIQAYFTFLVFEC